MLYEETYDYSIVFCSRCAANRDCFVLEFACSECSFVIFLFGVSEVDGGNPKCKSYPEIRKKCRGE